MIKHFCYKGSAGVARPDSTRNKSRLITIMPETLIRIRQLPGNPCRGRIMLGALTLPCALGKGGVTRNKREGDGATPAGRFGLRQIWYRADEVPRPRTRLPLRITRLKDGWCDASGHRCYNRAVNLPFKASHERMWRDDHVYNYVVEIGWNDRPVIKGRGSAIFLHLARPHYTPTEGCIAVSRRDMLLLLCKVTACTRIDIA